MKKLFTLLMLMCIGCMGAWADFTPVSGATYLLKCIATDHGGSYIGLDSNNSIDGRSSTGTLIEFEQTSENGQYYLKSVELNQYINYAGSGENVSVSSTASTMWSIRNNSNNFFISANGSSSLNLNNNAGNKTYHLKVVAAAGDCSKWTAERVIVSDINVTYKFMFEGMERKRVTVPCAEGEGFPQATSSIPYGVSATWPAGTVTSSDNGREIEVNCELSSANEIPWANSFEEVQWRAMKMRGGYMYSDDEGSASDTHKSYDYFNYKNFEWGFIGNPFSFKIVNRGIGQGKYLTHSGNTVTYNDTGDTFQTTASTHSSKTNGKFVIEDTTASSQTTLHSTNDGHNYALWVWTSGSAIGDDGSQVSIKDPDVDLLNQVKSTAIADMPDYEAAINALTSCDAISEYVIPVTYTLKGYWSENDVVNLELGSVTINRPRGSLAYNVFIPDLVFYSPDRVAESNSTVDADHKTFTLYCVPNFPFTAGKLCRIQALGGNANQKDWYATTDETPLAKYNVNDITVPANSNLWMFEHVAGTESMFTIKNYANGLYLTSAGNTQGSGNGARVAATLESSICGGGSELGTVEKSSVFKVATGKDGHFVLLHPKNTAIALAGHIDDANAKQVGGWKSGSESDARNLSDNQLRVLDPESFTATLNAISGDGYYGTIYSDLDMTMPEGIKAYRATLNNNALHLDEVEGQVPAGAYVLYKSDESASEKITATVSMTTPTEAELDNVLTGTLIEGKTFESEVRYALSGKNGIGFYKYNPATYPVAKAVYIPAELTQVAAFYFDFGDPVVTAIQDLQRENQKKGAIFDLQGRRIQKVQKGLNIVNGMKVIR